MTRQEEGRPARRALRRAATALSGAVLLAATAAVLVTGEQVPTADEPVPAADVSVPATGTAQVCAGPPRLATAAAGEDLTYDEFDPEGSGTASLLGALSLAVDGLPPADSRLVDVGGDEVEDLAFHGDARLTVLDDPAEALVLRAAPTGDRNALATGTTVSTSTSGDLRGLSATTCQSPAAGAWLVGGSTEPGNSAQLVLTNAGETAATVTLDAWGSTGPIATDSVGAVLVPPHSQRVVLLEAVVPGEPRLAVQLDVTGGEVAATLQDSRLRGLVPAGTDIITPGASPSSELVVPGLVLGESSPQDEDPAVVRVVNPGEVEARVAVELLGPEGPLPVPGAEDLVLDPGVVIDVSLAGLPAGAWNARVTADVPVTAAAMLTSTGTPADGDAAPVDRAWVPATTAFASGLAAVPGLDDPVGRAQLVLANPASEAVGATVTPVLADGTLAEPVDLDLVARGSATLQVGDLADGTVVALEVSGDDGAEVHGAVYLLGGAPDGTLLAVLPVPQDSHAALSVTLAPAPRVLG